MDVFYLSSRLSFTLVSLLPLQATTLTFSSNLILYVSSISAVHKSVMSYYDPPILVD